MDDFSTLISAGRNRQRAEECRQRAREARSGGIATELEQMARDYERDAARIDASPHRQVLAFA